MSKTIKVLGGKTYLQLPDVDAREAAKKLHTIDSAFFRIKHICTMIEEKRPIEDFTDEIQRSFRQAIEQLEAEIEILKRIYEN